MANQRFKTGHYAGNKWGGKFLRAPDIFYTILEKGKGKLVELGKIAKVRRGFTTGANEFFYLDEKAQKEWNIEGEFLKPVIKSPKECESIVIDPRKLKFKVFICNKPKSELKGMNALKYIEWGEQQKTENGVLWCKVPSVSGRKLWYDLGEQEPQNFILLRFRDKRNWTPIVRNDIAIGDVVFVGKYMKDTNNEFMDFYLNSTVQVLIIEIYGRKNLGDGLLTTYGPELKILPVMHIELDDTKRKKVNDVMKKMCSRDVESIFVELGLNPSRPIREQEPKPLPDRAELDKIVFDELGLTEMERKEVYWAVCELVKQRLEKARSLRE